jgi:hypothetical protein
VQFQAAYTRACTGYHIPVVDEDYTRSAQVNEARALLAEGARLQATAHWQIGVWRTYLSALAVLGLKPPLDAHLAVATVVFGEHGVSNVVFEADDADVFVFVALASNVVFVGFASDRSLEIQGLPAGASCTNKPETIWRNPHDFVVAPVVEDDRSEPIVGVCLTQWVSSPPLAHGSASSLEPATARAVSCIMMSACGDRQVALRPLVLLQGALGAKLCVAMGAPVPEVPGLGVVLRQRPLGAKGPLCADRAGQAVHSGAIPCLELCFRRVH